MLVQPAFCINASIAEPAFIRSELIGSFCTKGCSLASQNTDAARAKEQKDGPYRKVWFNNCLECSRLFVARRVHTRCCGNNCSTQYISRVAVGIKAERCCVECGKAFRPAYRDKCRMYCSDKCAQKETRRAARRKHRARLRSVYVELVKPIEVLRRDGWKCQLCRTKTPKHLRGTIDGRAPELDHIVPLSRNGQHSYINTQCACRSCNAKKSNSLLGQLRLFG